jgi:hypothetical protein
MMFIPKCYTLRNEMYNPKKEIRKVRDKIRQWSSKLDYISNDEILNQVYETIMDHIDDEYFPVIDMQFYEETLEGWNLITHRNKLEKEYPRDFYEVLLEEKRAIREITKMMKEDDKHKW